MKTSKVITGCALAAGLMAFAPVQSQAGVVIGNNIYAPTSVKMTYSYVNNKGKIQKVRLSNKDLLFGYWNYPKGTQLAYGPDGGIYAINRGVVLDNLSTEGYMSVELVDYIDSFIPGKSAPAGKYSESGLVYIDFYSDANVFGDNYYDFEVSGTYLLKGSASTVNNKGIVTVNESFSTSNLTGDGYDNDLTGDELPVAGTATASGGGKLLY